MTQLENDAGDRVVFSMAERDQGRSYASLCGECFGRSRKNEKRLAARLFTGVDAGANPSLCRSRCRTLSKQPLLLRNTQPDVAPGIFRLEFC